MRRWSSTASFRGPRMSLVHSGPSKTRRACGVAWRKRPVTKRPSDTRSPRSKHACRRRHIDRSYTPRSAKPLHHQRQQASGSGCQFTFAQANYADFTRHTWANERAYELAIVRGGTPRNPRRLMRPLGGAVTGHIGDRFGRRAALTFSVVAMAIPTFLIGLLPGYRTLACPFDPVPSSSMRP